MICFSSQQNSPFRTDFGRFGPGACVHKEVADLPTAVTPKHDFGIPSCVWYVTVCLVHMSDMPVKGNM